MSADRPQPPESAHLDDVAMELLSHAAMLVRLVQRELPGDVGPTAAGVMTALEERPHRISELVDSERLAQPTLTALVIGLENRGWVRRTRDETDRRAVWVSLTEAGRARKRQLHAEVDALLHERLADTPPQLRRSLREAVTTLELVVQAMRRVTSEQGQPSIGAAGSIDRRRSPV
jgi:DNA-binding MarR family transcriptional regulator